MKKKMLSKSELFKEGYVKGLKKAQSLIEQMLSQKQANNILLESFKDDILNGYKKLGYETQNNRLLTTIKAVNSQNEIKELVKRQVGKVPNVGLAVTKKYTPEEFIDFVSKAQQNLNIKQQQQREKEQRKQKASSASDDYYIYPCRTFEEAHEAAFSHTGNLKRLSREEREKFFKDEYNIVIPKRRTYFQTNMTPAQMLQFMKECPVFMEPTWCVCADKNDWKRYKLDSTKDEDAKCFVVISKTYPNVRFCVTKDTDNNVHSNRSEGDYVIRMKGFGEFRDIWQIGGGDARRVGMKMAELAFGDISDILNNVVEKQERVAFEEITDGSELFYKNVSLTSFNKKLTSLVTGQSMFIGCSNLKSFTIELPHLTNGSWMFSNCTKLTSFTSELPSLINGQCMFQCCHSLKSFTIQLPNLTKGSGMFEYCNNLTSFISELPKLTNGWDMFESCSNLTSFTSDLPSLTNGAGMFSDCKNLKSFTSKLPSLTDGEGMFRFCSNLTSFSSELPSLKIGGRMFEYCKLDKPSVINILTSISSGPKHWRKCITIGTGYDYTKDEDTLQAIEEAENKGWKVEIEYNY